MRACPWCGYLHGSTDERGPPAGGDGDLPDQTPTRDDSVSGRRRRKENGPSWDRKELRKHKPGFEPGVSSVPRTRVTEVAVGPESGYLSRKYPLCVLLISLLATLFMK